MMNKETFYKDVQLVAFGFRKCRDAIQSLVRNLNSILATVRLFGVGYVEDNVMQITIDNSTL